jgi:hypothetical protein
VRKLKSIVCFSNWKGKKSCCTIFKIRLLRLLSGSLNCLKGQISNTPLDTWGKAFYFLRKFESMCACPKLL